MGPALADLEARRRAGAPGRAGAGRGVSGARAADVRRAAAVADGQPLARVDLDAVRHRVEALAAVESADVTREWPHQVRIDVTERTVVAVVEIAGRIRGMDASGVLFRDYATAPPGLPRVRVSTDTREDALAEAARVVGALPASISGIVDHVEVQTVGQISLVLRAGREVTWGRADQSDLKAEVLTGLLSDVKDAHAYDVSVPEQPTTR